MDNYNDIRIEDINFTDGKKRVLILGNGISRLDHMESLVKQWTKAELWVCNNAFKEFVAGELPRLDLLTGDKPALKEAICIKEENKFKFKIVGKNKSAWLLEGVEPIGIPEHLIYESGSSLVCKAIIDGFDEIYLVGFDLGGKDIYVKDHDKRNKAAWVFRWRLLVTELGIDKIIFVGKDHKSFIHSSKPIDSYAKQYMNDKNHLVMNIDSVEDDVKKYNSILILGNGTSRLDFDETIKNWKGPLWACNEAYKESIKYPITRIGSVHQSTICEAFDFRMNENLEYDLIGRFGMVEIKPPELYHEFKENRGWSTGSLLVAEAIRDHYEEICLAGFDFGGDDVYNKVVTGVNFKKQFIELLRMYPRLKNRIRFLGPKPEFI